ncbi:uncharacterized protein LOC144031131 [Festucalex cinctus]
MVQLRENRITRFQERQKTSMDSGNQQKGLTAHKLFTDLQRAFFTSMPSGKRTDDIEELKTFIQKMDKTITDLSQQMKESNQKLHQESNKKLLEEMQQLRNVVQAQKEEMKKKDLQIAILQEQVDELDQKSRINDVIITGIKVRPRTHVQATARRSEEDSDRNPDNESVEQQVITKLREFGIIVKSKHIQECYTLPSGGRKPPMVFMTLTNRKNKIALLKQDPKLKGKNVFLNENLTKKNAEIARKARQLRKDGKIMATWTANCKVFIKTQGSSPEEIKTKVIRRLQELQVHEN